MAKVREFVKLAEEYSEFADFAIIYIIEALPSDSTMRFKENINIDTHKSIENRIAAATILQKDFGTSAQILVDGMDDMARCVFAGMPERLVIMSGNKMVWQGGRGPMGYSIKALEEWCAKYAKQQQ